MLPPPDFESGASADSATRANPGKSYVVGREGVSRRFGRGVRKPPEGFEPPLTAYKAAVLPLYDKGLQHPIANLPDARASPLISPHHEDGLCRRDVPAETEGFCDATNRGLARDIRSAAPNWNDGIRTHNTRFRRPMLYPLRYIPIVVIEHPSA